MRLMDSKIIDDGAIQNAYSVTIVDLNGDGQNYLMVNNHEKDENARLIDEAFLEDINNILNNGEVPNLLSEDEDLINVIERMKEQYKADPDFKEHEGDQQWIYNKFITEAKNKLHLEPSMILEVQNLI